MKPSSPSIQNQHTNTMKKLTALLAVGFASLGIQSASAALISLYEFNGSTVDSVRGGAGTATISGTSIFESGVSGSAFRFNGSTFLSAPLAGAGLSAYSISAWVKFNSRTDWATILKNWGSSTAGAFHFGLDNNQFKISNYLGTTTGTPAVSSGNLTTGTWYNFAVTFGPSNTQKLYVNGTQVDSGAASGTILNNFNTMSMGAKLNNSQTGVGAPAGWLDGWLDDVAFYNEELSSSAVSNLYTAGLAGNGVSTLGFGGLPSAVPEPGQVAASLLLLSGIGGYVFLKRRKAAKSALAAA
jgi:hypothetical protein